MTDTATMVTKGLEKAAYAAAYQDPVAADYAASTAWAAAVAALEGITDPQARIMALLACDNAAVRKATLRVVSAQEVGCGPQEQQEDPPAECRHRHPQPRCHMTTPPTPDPATVALAALSHAYGIESCSLDTYLRIGNAANAAYADHITAVRAVRRVVTPKGRITKLLASPNPRVRRAALLAIGMAT
jgi:hypothetical protein